MPPKKKGSGKKPPKSKTPVLINGLTKEEMSKEQMEELIVQLREELDREREERNYFQLERDKIQTFWEVTKRKLEEAQAEVKTVEKNIEEDEERHLVEIKVYKQKMKHLLCEHHNTIAELKERDLTSARQTHKEQEELEAELCEEMRTITMKTLNFEIETLFNELTLKHEEEMRLTNEKWEKQFTDIRAEKEEKLQKMKDELSNWRKSRISETRHQWNSHLSALKQDHNNSLRDAQLFIDEVEETKKRSAALKELIAEQKGKEKEKLKDLDLTLKDNKCLSEWFSSAEEENAKFQRKMKHYSEKKETVYDVIEKMKIKELKNLEQEKKALESNFHKYVQNISLRLEDDKSTTQNIQRLQQEASVGSLQCIYIIKDLFWFCMSAVYKI
uniref:Dynein regulatory complex subunit 4-like n=1 Tax=Gouania willdenowi TaxID=441366 RepID=A0A8C5I5Y5_GOUWI